MVIAAKIMALFMAVLILVAAFVCYLLVIEDYQEVHKEHQQDAREIAGEMHDDIETASKHGGSAEIKQVVQTWNLPYRQVRIRWVRFNVHINHPDHPTIRSESISAIEVGRIMSEPMRDPSGNWLYTYHPIPIAGQDDGGLEIISSLDETDKEARQKIVIAGILTLALIAICAGIVFFGGFRIVGRPLDQLINKTEQVAKGEFREPVELKSRDEFAKLATALNQMGNQLADQQTKIQDETERRIAAIEQLRHADRLKTVGRLAAGIAHEIGTPLNVVSGRAAMIRSGKLSPDQINESAEAIKNEADRISQIVRQLLDFARHNSLNRADVDLTSIIDRTVELLNPLAKKRNVAVKTSYTILPAVASVDENQLQQVITNLIVNAIHSIEDSGEISVSVCKDEFQPPPDIDAEPGQYYRIDVRDSGCGMTQDTIDNIFEPFFTTKDIGLGTGLGLSIAFGIAREHGGWIEVASDPGKGSVFSVFIPGARR